MMPISQLTEIKESFSNGMQSMIKTRTFDKLRNERLAVSAPRRVEHDQQVLEGLSVGRLLVVLRVQNVQTLILLDFLKKSG